MPRPKGRIALLFVLLALLIGAVLYFSAEDPADVGDEITPTSVPTMSDTTTPEPSVAEDPSPTPEGAVSGDEGIRLSEVAGHSSSADCWMAIDGQVYDVTQFVNEHPGGEAIVMGCGTDATELFENRPNDKGPHSEVARALLPLYYIGDLVE